MCLRVIEIDGSDAVFARRRRKKPVRADRSKWMVGGLSNRKSYRGPKERKTKCKSQTHLIMSEDGGKVFSVSAVPRTAIYDVWVNPDH